MENNSSDQNPQNGNQELEKSTFDHKPFQDQMLNKLFHAVEQSPSAVMITDASGVIEYVNPRFTEITGFSAEEVIGNNAGQLGEQAFEEEQNMWDTIKTGEVWHGEFHNKKKSGEYYWERASISSLKNEKGTITHFVKMSEDITALKETQNALMEAEKRRVQDQKNMAILKFANDLALKLMDELRNPLTAIGGLANRITQRDHAREKWTEYAKIIFDESQKLDAALDRALNYLRDASEKTAHCNLPDCLE